MKPGDGKGGNGDARTPMIAWFTLAVLTLGNLSAIINRVAISLVVVPMQRDLGITDTQFGLLTGIAFAVFYTLMGFPMGMLADRYSRRRLIGWGMVVWSVTTGLFGVMRSFAELFLLRAGVGLGEAVLQPAALSMLTDLFPRAKLGRAITIMSAGGALGAGLAYLLGASVVAMVDSFAVTRLPWLGRVASWQIVFFACMAPGLVAAALMPFVREPARMRVRGPATPADALLPFLRAQAGPLLLYTLAFALETMMFNAFAAWMPALLARKFTMSTPRIGLALGLMIGVAAPLGMVLGGAACDSFTRRGRADAPLRTAILGSLMMAPFALMVPLVPKATLAVALLAPLFLALSFSLGMGTAGLQMVTPGGLRARMTALYLIVVNLVGTALGPLVVALLTDRLFHDRAKIDLSLAVVVAVIAPMIVLCLLVARRRIGDAILAVNAAELAA